MKQYKIVFSSGIPSMRDAIDVRDKIVGSSRDSATDLTLYGLKAYIDSKLSKLK